MSFQHLRLLLCLSALSFSLLGCGSGHQHGDDDDDDSAADDDDDSVPVEFAMESPDFIDDSEINHSYDCDQALPVEFSCYGANPQITWEGAPEGTVAFALIFDDISFNEFPHWAIFNIPAGETGLDAGISGYDVNNSPPGDAVELENGGGWLGYLGSCPGAVNHYRWRLWALSEELPLDSNTTYGEVAAEAEARALDMVSMCHVFDGAATAGR
jgi:Raf kinase inhibitor-like YbhB/YbcL family protein